MYFMKLMKSKTNLHRTVRRKNFTVIYSLILCFRGLTFILRRGENLISNVTRMHTTNAK